MMLWLIAALPPLAAAGQFVPVVGPVFGYRIAVAVLAYLTAKDLIAARRWPTSRFWRHYVVVAGIWAAWGAASLIWASSRSAALRELLSVTVGLTVLAALALQLRDRQRLAWFAYGWVAAFALYAAIGVFEVVTDVHLPNYFAGTERWRIPPRMPASVFQNPNNFAVFIVAAFPFLLLTWRRAASRRSRFLLAASIVLAFPLVFVTGARLTIFALLGVALTALALRGRPRAFLAGATLVVAWIMVPYIAPGSVLATGLGGTESALAQSSSADIVREIESGQGGTSAGLRMNLYRNGLWLLTETRGRGAGAGQFQALGQQKALPIDTGYQTSPHNLVLEVWSQYGVVVGLAATWIVVLSIRSWVWGARRHSTDEWSDWKLMAALIAVALPFISLQTSSFVSGNVSWLTLAPLVVVPVLDDERRARAAAALDSTQGSNVTCG